MSGSSTSPSILLRLTSYFSKPEVPPPSTEEIRDVHRQLQEWRNEDPPSLVPHLRSCLDRHIAESTLGMSDYTTRMYNQRSKANRTGMTYGKILSALDPSTPNQPVLIDDDMQTSWDEHKVRHDRFHRAVDAYWASLAAVTIASFNGYTGPYTAVSKEFDRVTREEWVDQWLTRLNTLTSAVLNGSDQGDSKYDHKSDMAP